MLRLRSLDRSGSIKRGRRFFSLGFHPTRGNDCKDRRFLTAELRELISSQRRERTSERASENKRARERTARASLRTRLIDVPSTSSRFYRSNYTPSDPFERFVEEKFRQQRYVPRLSPRKWNIADSAPRVSGRTFRTFRPTANDSFHSREQRETVVFGPRHGCI